MVRTVGLRKAYGPQTALAGVDLEVPPGSLYGLLGPNGAGKTTLLEILAGLRRQAGGRVELGASQAAVAYCPDVAEFEPWLSAVEVLEAALGLLGTRRPRRELEALLGHVGLGDVSGRRVGGFSRGMTTRLNLAAGLAGEPKILILDEPVSSLDPAGRVDVLRLIASLAPATTVLLSSHDLSEIETICECVGILNEGRLLYQGKLDDLLVGPTGSRWAVIVRPPATAAIAALEEAPWISSLTEQAPGELEFFASDATQVERYLPAVLAGSDSRVVSISPLRPRLEEVFLNLTATGARTENGSG